MRLLILQPVTFNNLAVSSDSDAGSMKTCLYAVMWCHVPSNLLADFSVYKSVTEWQSQTATELNRTQKNSWHLMAECGLYVQCKHKENLLQSNCMHYWQVLWNEWLFTLLCCKLTGNSVTVRDPVPRGISWSPAQGYGWRPQRFWRMLISHDRDNCSRSGQGHGGVGRRKA